MGILIGTWALIFSWLRRCVFLFVRTSIRNIMQFVGAVRFQSDGTTLERFEVKSPMQVYLWCVAQLQCIETLPHLRHGIRIIEITRCSVINLDSKRPLHETIILVVVRCASHVSTSITGVSECLPLSPHVAIT